MQQRNILTMGHSALTVIFAQNITAVPFWMDPFQFVFLSAVPCWGPAAQRDMYEATTAWLQMLTGVTQADSYTATGYK